MAKSKRLKPGKFGKHEFASWTDRQLEAYTTKVTGIKPDQGSSRDRHAGRTKGSYIKGKI